MACIGPSRCEGGVVHASSRGDVLTPQQLPVIREQWMDKIADLVGGLPPNLPPFQEVNHEINPIDPGKRIVYCLPKCPDALKAELTEKISRYTSVGWWVPTTA